MESNARTMVLQRGGDVSDRQEVLGEYVLQFGKYKGKCFQWLRGNDVGYILSLMKKVDQEEKAGQFNPGGPSKESLLYFLKYCRTFKVIVDLENDLS